ncbi:MAG: hypothetical protein WAU78_04885, partial [Roseiarcus sp.]
MPRVSTPPPKRLRPQYFLSRAGADGVRTIAFSPAALWSLIAVVAIALVWGGAATLYLAFHDSMLGALATRQAEMQYAYEDRLAEARAELDRVASRQLLDQNSFEGKVHELLSRQAQLEQRGSIVAALVDQASRDPLAAAPMRSAVVSLAKAPAGALPAIGAASPLGPSDSVIDPSTQAFAPQPPTLAPPSAPK